MPNRKVDQSLQYRWGIVGCLLAIGFFVWYIKTSGNERSAGDRGLINKDLVKIVCIRCNNDPVAKKTCSLCNGYGYMWVDSTRKDLSPDVQVRVEQALLEKEEEEK